MTELTDMSDVNASTHLSELDTSDDILKLCRLWAGTQTTRPMGVTLPADIFLPRLLVALKVERTRE